MEAKEEEQLIIFYIFVNTTLMQTNCYSREHMEQGKKLKILYLITKSNFGEAESFMKRFFRNPRFLTLPQVAVFLHGRTGVLPTPLPRPAV